MSALELPTKIGVMILPDCTLFPHGGLPLHIFEERYRQMLQDAIASNAFFAIARAKKSADPNNPGATEIGTVGMIRASHLKEDGTSDLLLHGIIRVRFTKWLNEKPYPYAEIAPLPATFHPAEQAEAATTALRGFVEDAIDELPDEIKSAVMEMLTRTDDPCILADIVSQQFFQDPDHRQMLLEELSTGTRISWICRSLQQ